MQITTRFDLGESAYAIASSSACNVVPCAFCAAEGHIEGRNDKRRVCPECHGRGSRDEWLPLAWRVQDGPLTIGQVRVEATRSPGIEGKQLFANYKAQEGDEEHYMMVETGIGSGTLYSAADLFATRDEAEAACAERNTAEGKVVELRS